MKTLCVIAASNTRRPRSGNMPALGTSRIATVMALIFIVNLFALGASLVAQTKQTPAVAQSSPLESIPDVDFCDVVREPQKFFDQTVRVKASWLQGHEFSYLGGVNCRTKIRSEIAVGWVNGRDPMIVAAVEKLLSREYGARGNITAVGTLRNPGKYFGFYRYRFEILRIEDVQHVIEPYQAKLQAGHTYRAVVRGDKEIELRLIPQLHIEMHYSVGIDWTNLSDFPELEKLHQTRGERTIVFSPL